MLHFGTYPAFEPITRIHIDVNFQEFTHVRNKPSFFKKVKYKQNKKIKNLFFYHEKKMITALKNQNINIILSYNIDSTRNAGNLCPK